MKLVSLPVALFVITGPLAFSASVAPATPSTNSAMTPVTRVSKDSLRDKLTAKNLIGKDVYDSHGKKIGSVHDVVIADQHSSLGAAMAGSSSTNDMNNNSTAGNMGVASGSTEESAVIISTGHFGMGGSLIRVPISQVNYDASQHRLTLSLTEDDLNQLKDSTPSSTSSSTNG